MIIPRKVLSHIILELEAVPGESDILNPMAIENNGFRKLMTIGNSNFKTEWTIMGLEDGIYYWSVQAIDGAMAGSVFSQEGIFTIGSVLSSENESLPNEFKLGQNYPNPFNPATTIKYMIKDQSLVSLKIYDVLGNEVATLVNEIKPKGAYTFKFDASSLPSGVYFYRLTAGNFIETKKMLLLK